MKEPEMRKAEIRQPEREWEKENLLRTLSIASLAAAIFPATVVSSIVLGVMTIQFSGKYKRTGVVSAQCADAASILGKAALIVRAAEFVLSVVCLLAAGPLILSFIKALFELIINVPSYY